MEESSCLSRTAKGTIIGGFVGAFIGSLNVSLNSIQTMKTLNFRHTARNIGQQTLLIGGVGGTFALGDCVAGSIRDKEDLWNGVWGSIAAGSVITIANGKILTGVKVAAAGSLCCVALGIWQQLNSSEPAQHKKLEHTD